MKTNKLLKSKRGITLVEMLVVIFTFGIILAGAAAFFSYSLKSTRIISETAHSQSELRVMMLTIKQEANIAKRAFISDTYPSLAGLEEGTQIFYEKDGTGTKKTMSVETVTGSGTTTRDFAYIENFELNFIRSDDDRDNAVFVSLSVKGNKKQFDVLLEDEFYLGNLKKTVPANSLDEGEDEGKYLVITPTQKLAP